MGGFIKDSSSDSYVLLGGGGHSELKTINGNSLFGSGNIVITSSSGGGDGNTLYYLTLNNAVNGHSSGTNLGTLFAPTAGGTAGLYLKSNGATSAPTWVNFPGITSHQTVSGTFWGNSWSNGDSLSGKITVAADNWAGLLLLNRTNNGSNWGASIAFQGSGSNRGAIHMEGNELYVGDVSGTFRYKVLTENNWNSTISVTGGDGDTKYYLTLNGTNKGHTSGTNLGSFYAPTSAGTSGQYLKSNGSGAPTWATFDFASSGHSHTLKIEADSGTPSITLSADTTYKLTAGGSTYLFKTPADLVGSSSSGVSGYWANIPVQSGSDSSKSPTFSWMYATGGVQIASGDTSSAKLAVGGNVRIGDVNNTGGFKLYFGDSEYSYIGERSGDSDDIVIYGKNGIYLNTDDNIYFNAWAYTKTLDVKGRILSRINAAISSSQSNSYGGGYYYAVSNPNIQFIGDNTYGISTIEFVSQKGGTTINKPSDCAFIQYQPYGSTKSSIGSQPTLASSGESGKFIIGIHNDSDDLLCLLTSSTTGLKHVVGENEYTILTSGNYSTWISGGGGGSVSVGSVTSGTYQVVGVDTSDTSALKYLATSGGHFYFTTSGAYHTSDERMKHDIWDILQDDVDELFGTNNGYIRHFAWNSNDVEAYGFIAQELEEFCPEAIHINEDGYYGVNYNVAFSKILGAMFKKIKQQDKEIKKLKKIIEKHK